MNTALGGSSAMVLRFRAERQILARLEHRNIARLLLDRGAERIDRDLASTPEVRAAMLEKIGLA